MNAACGLFRLMRGDRLIKEHPTVDDVTKLIQEVYADTVKGGPPELCVDYHSNSARIETPQFKLLLMLTFDDDPKPLWLVLFRIPGPPSSYLVLSKCTGVASDYVHRSCCGLDSLYRRDTLIDDEILLLKVIDHFLKQKEALPEFAWISYDDAVHLQ
ncbi:MAG: hypothetical protein ACK5TO_00800 [Planctomycetaceae bacterium]